MKKLMEWLPYIALTLAGLAAFAQFWATKHADDENSRTQAKLIEAQEKLIKFNEERTAEQKTRQVLLKEELRILHRRMCQELNGAMDTLLPDSIVQARRHIDQNTLRYTRDEVFLTLGGAHHLTVEPAHWISVGKFLDAGLGEAYRYIQPFFSELPPEQVKSIVRALTFKAPASELPVRISKKLSEESKEQSEAISAKHQISWQYNNCAQHFSEFAPEYLHPDDPLRTRIEESRR